MTTATHPTGTREQWLAARLDLLKAEKELTRRSDEIARQRQQLPWVPRSRVLRQLDDPAAIVRDLAFTKLRYFLSSDLKNAIERRLSDPSEVVRWTALEYLVELDPAGAVGHAKTQLDDSDPTVRALAASKLKYPSTHQPKPSPPPPRAEVTAEQTSAEARYAHARTLADRAEPSSRDELHRLSRDEDPMIRKLAIRGLARIKDPADHSILAAALRHRMRSTAHTRRLPPRKQSASTWSAGSLGSCPHTVSRATRRYTHPLRRSFDDVRRLVG